MTGPAASIESALPLRPAAPSRSPQDDRAKLDEDVEDGRVLVEDPVEWMVRAGFSPTDEIREVALECAADEGLEDAEREVDTHGDGPRTDLSGAAERGYRRAGGIASCPLRIPTW